MGPHSSACTSLRGAAMLLAQLKPKSLDGPRQSGIIRRTPHDYETNPQQKGREAQRTEGGTEEGGWRPQRKAGLEPHTEHGTSEEIGP